MKVKNIMFSGFMAVILSGVACSADAAGFQVASKQYVDAREDAIVAAQAQVDADQNTEIEKKANAATTLAGYGITDAYTKAEVEGKFETIANVDEKVKKLEDTIGGTGPDGSTGIVSTVEQQGTRITELETKVGDESVADQISAALVTYTTQNIDGLSDKVTTLEGTVGNSTDGLVKDVADLQAALTETGSTGALIKANADAIDAINSETDGILKLAKDYTDTLADGAVATNAAEIAAIKNETTGVLATAKKYADEKDTAQTTAITTAYEAYALPKPTAECANTTCVLATDKNGQPYWTQLWMYGTDGESATANQ